MTNSPVNRPSISVPYKLSISTDLAAPVAGLLHGEGVSKALPAENEKNTCRLDIWSRFASLKKNLHEVLTFN